MRAGWRRGVVAGGGRWWRWVKACIRQGRSRPRGAMGARAQRPPLRVAPCSYMVTLWAGAAAASRLHDESHACQGSTLRPPPSNPARTLPPWPTIPPPPLATAHPPAPRGPGGPLCGCTAGGSCTGTDGVRGRARKRYTGSTQAGRKVLQCHPRHPPTPCHAGTRRGAPMVGRGGGGAARLADSHAQCANAPESHACAHMGVGMRARGFMSAACRPELTRLRGRT